MKITDMRLVLTLFLILSHAAVIAETLSGRVVRVTDGDIIVILDSNKVQHKFRLQGIDAEAGGS